jgi:thymidine kinase
MRRFGANTSFDPAAVLAGAAPRPACLLIDEAQFLTREQVRQLHRLVHRADIPVLCWGLRSDFQGHAFAGAAELLTLADDLEELKTICACGRKASMNLRLDAQGHRVTAGEQVLIGGNDRYRAVCPRCFYSDAGDTAAPGLFG